MKISGNFLNGHGFYWVEEDFFMRNNRHEGENGYRNFRVVNNEYEDEYNEAENVRDRRDGSFGRNESSGRNGRLNMNERLTGNDRPNRNERLNRNERFAGNNRPNRNGRLNRNELFAGNVSDDGYERKYGESSLHYGDEEDMAYERARRAEARRNEARRNEAPRNETRRNEARQKIKRKRRRERIALIATFLVALILFVTLISCTVTHISGSLSGEGSKASKKSETVEINMLCVGDVMAHQPNIRAALTAGGGSKYDFSDVFELTKPYIEEADVAMCNVETTFGGGEPSGYPLFCAPDELAANLKDAGFDVAFTSNNHMMDTGFDGMQRTLEILRGQGFTTAGSRYDGEDRWSIIEVKGVKIGLVAYTYETTGSAGDTVSINGNNISDESANLINSFNYNEIDTDIEKMGQDIKDAEAAGADIIVAYMHWGTEYQRQPSDDDKYIAQSLADLGADVIFASHPHVVQPIDIIQSSSGKNVPVYYSMGNFISNQRQETLKNRYTEQGLMAMVTLTVDTDSDEVKSGTAKTLPTWVDKYGSSIKYAVIPLDENFETCDVLSVSGHLSRAQQGLDDVTELVGADYLNGVSFDNTASASDTESESDKKS